VETHVRPHRPVSVEHRTQSVESHAPPEMSGTFENKRIGGTEIRLITHPCRNPPSATGGVVQGDCLSFTHGCRKLTEHQSLRAYILARKPNSREQSSGVIRSSEYLPDVRHSGFMRIRIANRMSATISESQDWVREKRATSGPDSPRGTERFLPGFRNIGKHRSVRR